MADDSNKPEQDDAQTITIDWPTLILFTCFVFSLVFLVASIYSFNLPVEDGQPTPFAPDYLAFWAAGHMTLDNQAIQAYDLVAHASVEAQGIGRTIGQLPWLNPPPFLLFVAPFAILPFMFSHYVWVYVSMMALGFTAFRLIPHRNTVLAVLSYPAVFFCLGVGQTGLLTATLLGLFAIWHERRPALAGLLIGCMIIKPQLALLAPLVLIASGNWRAFFSAMVTIAVLSLVTTMLFGLDIWSAFYQSFTQYSNLASTEPHYLMRMQSLYGFMIFIGAPTVIATLFQGILSLALAIGVIVIWRKPFSYEVKGAAFIVASVMITPYIQIYEFPIVAIAGVFLWRAGMAHGFLKWEQAFIALFACSFLLLLPLFAPFTIRFPAWGLFMFIPLGLVVQRILHERAQWVKS